MFPVKQLNLALTLVLVALNVAALNAYTQSECKKWYSEKNPVHGMTPTTAKLLRQEDLASSPTKILVRRITPVQNSHEVAGGATSACGNGYDSSKVSGVCLWTGSSQPSDKSLSKGWISGDEKNNCGKTVYVKDNGGATYYAPVLDGCQMDIQDLDTGCANIWVTEALFNQLDGRGQQGDTKVIKNWDFNENSAF